MHSAFRAWGRHSFTKIYGLGYLKIFRPYQWPYQNRLVPQIFKQSQKALTRNWKKITRFLRKCINENYRNGLLTKTEAVCIDNCVKKYLEFNHHVTIHLRELQEPQTLMQFEMQQQELGRQMGLWLINHESYTMRNCRS